MNQKYTNGCMLLDLGVLYGGLQAGERIKGQRVSKNMDAVQTIMLGQNKDEVVLIKIFKEQPWIFAYNEMVCSYWHPKILV